MGVKARRPAGEMDQRPLGILPHRLCRPRSRDDSAARASERRPHHGVSRRSPRHLRRADRDLCAAEQRLSRRHHGLRHSADAHALPLGDDQHRADRAVPRRRPPRSDAGAGAADRSGRRQARHRPAAAPPEERHPEEQAALPHRERAALRQRRLHGQHEAHDRGGRLEGLCRAAARVEEARQAPRHRHLELSGDAGRHPARAGRGHRARHRQGRACGRHAIDRPGPRDELCSGDGGPARRASRGHHLHRRRHRENSVGQRHPFRPLDAARRHADVPGFGRGGGAGQGGRGEDA